MKLVAFAAFLVLFGANSLGQSLFRDAAGVDQIIKQEMSRDDALNSAKIRTRVVDGYVTLEGYVDNLWQKDRLVEIAQNIQGVSGVIDHLYMAGACVESEELAKALALELYRDDTADVYELQVATDDQGRARVSGLVDSSWEKDAAISAVKKVKGVVGVQDWIGRTQGGDRSDSELQNDLEFALYDSVLIDERLIETQVQDRVATIEGNVGSRNEIMAIEEIVDDLDGIHKARVTELTVVPRFDRSIVFRISPGGEGFTDEELAKAVDRANYYDTRIMSSSIKATASQGVVELSGKAVSEQAKQAALENAKNTVGAIGVVDKLVVDEFVDDKEFLAE